MVERCIKIIYNLSRAAKLSWGLKKEAFDVMCKVAILPLLMYGTPVWNDAIEYKQNRQRYVRVQRLSKLKMARAYRTTSEEALCILTGMTPITL